MHSETLPNSLLHSTENLSDAMVESAAAVASIAGQFRVCITDHSLQNEAMALGAAMTEAGQPVLILDAGSCFDPSRISRCTAHTTGRLRVLRASGSESISEIWARLAGMQQDQQARQVLVVGLLDRLYDPNILTRDASRLLGEIKTRLEHLAADGIDVTVLCQSRGGQLSTRSHFLSSLCASADAVQHCSLAH